MTAIGDWVRERVLGSGGFGHVLLWTNTNTNTALALKTLRVEESGRVRSAVVERWAKEVEIMRRLSHPNVVKGLAVPEELLPLSPAFPILCMEYCEQGDLRKVLNLSENCSGLEERAVRRVLSDVADAVEYLHSQRITHRDLKPENIVIKEEEAQLSFKLIDLGYAKEWDQNSLCSSFVGTLQYVAPEIFTQVYTSSVDYWSLGLVCHEIITGSRPFLPNMAPHSWMPLVKKKTFDDICIYQNEDDSIEYSQQLSACNRISQSLRCGLEAWLRLALEWNGRRRGYSQDGNLIIFSSLRAVLAKKIVTVFSTVSLEMLSYEVDSSTAVSTLKEWIKRDTRIGVAEQLLLLPTGQRVEEDILASSLWDPANEIAMVYLFPTDGLQLHCLEPKIPLLVKEMLQQPRVPHKYYFLRKIWAEAVYFLQQEFFVCQALMEAYAVTMLSLILASQEVLSLDQEVNNQLQQTLAYLKFYADSVDYDSKCWNSINPHNQGVDGPKEWKQEEEKHRKEIGLLRQIGEKLGAKISFLTSTISKLQLFSDSFQNPLDQLTNLLEMAYVVYKDLQRRPKELRDSKAESVDLSMYKIIQNSLKEREAFLTNKSFANHLLDLKKCERELVSILNPLRSYEQHLRRVRTALRKSQLEKQKSVWKLVLNKEQVSNKTNSYADDPRLSPGNGFILRRGSFGNASLQSFKK